MDAGAGPVAPGAGGGAAANPAGADAGGPQQAAPAAAPPPTGVAGMAGLSAEALAALHDVAVSDGNSTGGSGDEYEDDEYEGSEDEDEDEYEDSLDWDEDEDEDEDEDVCWEGGLLGELHQAICEGDDATVARILSAPGGAALVNACSSYGWTALHHACADECSKASIVRLLLQHGADANARTADGEGRTPLVRGAASSFAPCCAAARAYCTSLLIGCARTSVFGIPHKRPHHPYLHRCCWPPTLCTPARLPRCLRQRHRPTSQQGIT